MRKSNIKESNNGITLIALVITIIVLLVLAGVTISTLTSDNGLIEKTSEAQFKTEIAAYKEELDLSIIEDEGNKKANRTQKFNATSYNDIKKLIPSFNQKYENILVVEEDKLVYKGNDKTLYKMAVSANLIPEDELLDDEILEELQPFITQWTVEAGDSITLPLNNYAHNKYDFTVDYGDGTEIKEVTSANDEDSIHTYENAGTYSITIKGNCPSFNFSNKSVSKDKITKIVQWGNTFKQDSGLNFGFSICFQNCTNLVDLIPAPSKNTFKSTTGFTNMFYGCSNITEVPEKLFYNAPCLTDLRGAFQGCTNLKSIPEKLFSHCEKVTGFQSTFSGCSSLTEIPENTFSNCYKASDFQRVFEGCNNIKKIPRNLFKNCKKASTFQSAFFACSSLEEVPEDTFDNCIEAISFFYTFGRCGKVVGNAPLLWEKFPDANGKLCFSGCNFENQSEIPSAWK